MKALLLVLLLQAPAHGELLWKATGFGEVKRADRCEKQLGRGGNYREPGFRLLEGKCDGTGLSPRIVGRNREEQHKRRLRFRAKGPLADGKTRSELLSVPYLPFNQTTFIGGMTRIPGRVERNQEFFSALQLWQCTGMSPIAMWRVKRGTKRTLQLITRWQNQIDANLWEKDLGSREVLRWTLELRPDPTGEKSLVRLWVNDQLVVTDRRPWGGNLRGMCGSGAALPEERYRVKFGIYRRTQAGRFIVDFPWLAVGTTYDAVQPTSGG